MPHCIQILHNQNVVLVIPSLYQKDRDDIDHDTKTQIDSIVIRAEDRCCPYDLLRLTDGLIIHTVVTTAGETQYSEQH